MTSICIQCGKAKRAPQLRCGHCGFKPSTMDEKAKSLMLSTEYEIEGEYRGKSKSELNAIGFALQQGEVVPFDAEEVRAVVAYARSVLSTPRRRLLIDMVRWLAPPVLFMAALFLAAYLLQRV